MPIAIADSFSKGARHIPHPHAVKHQPWGDQRESDMTFNVKMDKWLAPWVKQTDGHVPHYRQGVVRPAMEEKQAYVAKGLEAAVHFSDPITREFDAAIKRL